VSLKHRLIFNGLHGVISEKNELFVLIFCLKWCFFTWWEARSEKMQSFKSEQKRSGILDTSLFLILHCNLISTNKPFLIVLVKHVA
jgi:hypothetical protein